MSGPYVIPRVVRLRDGQRGVVRALVPNDEPYLREAFEHLSRHTKEMRFLSADVHPHDSDFDYLVHPDGENHLALVMERYPIDSAHREGIGVVRCIRRKDDPSVAEVAIVVVDEYQGKGAGTALLDALNHVAREKGIKRYWGLVRIDNDAVMKFLAESATLLEKRVYEPGVYETWWALPETD